MEYEVPILTVQEEVVHVSKTIPQEHIVEKIVEQVIEVPIPMILEEIEQVPRIIQQKRVHTNAHHLSSAPQPTMYCCGSRSRFCVQERGTERPSST